jgi:hypothetical protein
MAVDPTQLAEDQEARQRITAAGAPTEFAKGPEQEGIQVAGLGDVLKLLNKLPGGTSTPTPPTGGVVGVAPRVPTPQERGLMEAPELFSEAATKRELAPQILSPEGVQTFEQRGMTAPAIGEEPPADVITDAATALEDQAAEAERLAVDVNAEAQKALTAEARGFKPETGVASEEVADEVLTMLNTKEANVKSLQDGGDFNFDYLNTTDDVKAVITAIGETYADETVARTRGKISNDLTIREAAARTADEIGFSRELLNRKVGDRPLTAAEFVGAREILVRSASKLEELARLIKTGQGTAADRLKFRRQLAIHSGIQLQLKGAQTEAARALQSFQIQVSGELDATRFAEEAQRLLDESGSEGVTDALADRLLKVGAEGARGDDYMKKINDFAMGGRYAKTKQMVHEAYLAGLLSSPATQAKNLIGTAAFMLYQLPTEVISGMYGSVIRAGRKQLGMQFPISEDQVYMEDALLRVKGWSDAFGDAMKAASIAWRTEAPAGGSKLDVDQYAPGTRQTETFFGKSLEELGKRMRIPFRLLLSADEFTKTISQRGEFYTAINKRYQHSKRKGMTEQEAQDEAGMLLLDPRAQSDDLNLKARYDTLQSDLGKFGQVTGMLQRTLIGRFLLPFATAPTNALLRTMEYTPFSKTAIDVLGKNGPQAQQLALGRLTLGGATMYKVGQYAMDGRITGGLPSDQKQREALPPGWQPYSFVLKGEGFPEDMPLYDAFGAPNGPLMYVSYAGFEPVGGLIAITADTVQRANTTDDPALQQNYASAAMIATAEYYKELPMLQGVADLVAFMDGYDAAKLARSYAESSTPVGLPNPLSSMQRMIQRLIDPTGVRPREDVQYFTKEDILERVTDEDGTERYRYALIDGSPNYALIGLPKTDDGRKIVELFGEMNALQAKDSFFRDERDYNAIVYDTLGEPRGADEFSFANRPGAALFSNISGLRLKKGEELTEYEKELIRLQRMTNAWPLTNPREYQGIKLSYGMQSDLVNIAKNEITVRRSGYGDLTFRETLEVVTSEPLYLGLTDKQKVSLLRSINKQFIDEGFKTLIELPEYANMRQAYYDLQAQKDR